MKDLEKDINNAVNRAIQISDEIEELYRKGQLTPEERKSQALRIIANQGTMKGILMSVHAKQVTLKAQDIECQQKRLEIKKVVDK